MKQDKPSPKPKRPKPYHHGNLVEALLAGAIDIIEKQGVERLSVREVAKRAGVSPGAPFQHFASKEALLTAVAEQAMNRLTQAALEAEAKVEAEDSLSKLEAIGQGYLRWALSNPTHFEVVSSRRLIDFQSSSLLQMQNDAIRDRMHKLLIDAQARNELSPELAIDNVVLSCRAFVYGLARMAVDGHFPEWHPSEEPAVAATRALKAFIDGMRLKR
jgi:AcrR family transcriptional regulator